MKMYNRHQITCDMCEEEIEVGDDAVRFSVDGITYIVHSNGVFRNCEDEFLENVLERTMFTVGEDY